MATIINTPAQTDTGNGLTVVLVILLFIGVVLFLFALYGFPNFKKSTPQINVPDQIDVNLNQN